LLVRLCFFCYGLRGLGKGLTRKHAAVYQPTVYTGDMGEKPTFDNDEHERLLSERYAQLAMFDAFDALVDMALDGVITMEQAETAWKNDGQLTLDIK
jgi:hypothetical protein